jgi:hypothetical protein
MTMTCRFQPLEPVVYLDEVLGGLKQQRPPRRALGADHFVSARALLESGSRPLWAYRSGTKTS